MALNFGAFAGGFATGLSASQQAKRDQERLDLTRQRLGLDIEKRASDQDAALKEATEATRANDEFLGLQSPQGSPARRSQDAPGAETPQEPDEQAAIALGKANAKRLSEQKQKSIAKSAGISLVQELGKAGGLPESARPAYFKQVIANSMGLDPNDPKVKEMLGTVSKLTPVDQQEFFGLMTGAAVSAEGDEFTQLSRGFMTQQITIADYMGQLEGIISRSQQNMLADEGKAERPAAPVNLTMPQRGGSLEDEQIAPADQGQTAAGGQGRAVGKRIELSAPDRDILIRTVIGEAGNEPAQGKAAVVGVILNRMNAGGKYGQGLSGVVFAPNQFEPWGTEESANRLWRISPDSKAYKSAAAIVDAQLEGRVGDQSGGATHFFSPAGQRAMGRRDPRWASEMPETVRIGGHRFFREGDAAEPAPPVQTAALATTDARSDAVTGVKRTEPGIGTLNQPAAQSGTFGERVAQVQPEAASGGLRAATQGSTPAVREEGRKLIESEVKVGKEQREERESVNKAIKDAGDAKKGQRDVADGYSFLADTFTGAMGDAQNMRQMINSNPQSVGAQSQGPVVEQYLDSQRTGGAIDSAIAAAALAVTDQATLNIASRADALKAKLGTLNYGDVRKLFTAGSLTEGEWKIFQNLTTSLSLRQDAKTLTRNIQDAEKLLSKSRDRLLGSYKAKYGEELPWTETTPSVGLGAVKVSRQTSGPLREGDEDVPETKASTNRSRFGKFMELFD